MANRGVYLLSSNSRLKYFEDCLRALMLPREMILHFRYRTDHLDPEFVAAVRAGSVANLNVLVSYLYQENEGPKWVPTSIKPLRFGVITEARIDGPTAHIYFRVTGYPINAGAGIVDAANKAMTGGESPRYGALGATIDAQQSTEDTDNEAFIAIVEGFREVELRASFTGDTTLTQIDPLFVRVEGLYRKGQTSPALLTPVQIGASDRQRGYEIDSDDPLELRLRFHQPKWSKIDTKQYTLSLDVDRQYFGVPDHESHRIASPYDAMEFLLLPLRNNTGWLSRIALSSKSGVDDVVGNIVSFSALTRGTPRLWPWFNATIEALNPTVAILLAVASTFVAVWGKVDQTHADIPAVVWVIWSVAAALVVLNAVKAVRR
jgi:hypothetical protein